MAFLLKKNNATTTINMGGGFGAGVLTLVVTDGSVFPATGNFVLTLWDKASYAQPGEDPGMEIIKCTAVAGNSLTVTRAQENTADVAHANSEAVELLITAGQFSDIESQVVVGPASSTDNAIARFDLATGKLLQDSSGATLNDANEIALVTTGTTTNGLSVSSDTLTTGSLTRLYSNSVDTSARTLLKVINDNVLATSAEGIRIQQDGQGASNLGLYIYGDYTTGQGIQISGDSLTTGRLAYFYSNSADTSTRNLTEIVNDNVLAVGAVCLKIRQDAANYGVNIQQAGDQSGIVLEGITSFATASLLYIASNTITTGKLGYFYSNSADVSTRSLVYILNDNASATGTFALYVKQDAPKAGIYLETDNTTYGSASNAQGSLVVYGNSLTTGSLAAFYSDSIDVSSRNLVKITNDNSAATGARCLTIQQDADQRGLFIDQNGNGNAIEVDAECTTANVMNILADTLTTGGVAYFYSNSADASVRNLVIIQNDNTSAAQARCLNISQDANKEALYSECLGVTSADAYAIYCHGLTTGRALYINSNSADTSSRNLVQITNDNTAATRTTCLQITQDGVGATASAMYGMQLYTSGNATGLYLVGGNTTYDGLWATGNSLTTGRIAYFYSNSADTSTRYLVDIRNDNALATGAECLRLVQGAAARAMTVTQNANGAGIVIEADGTTTNNGLYVGCSGLTTGYIARFISNSADTSTRNLVQITNDNVLATGAVGLFIQQDAAAYAIFIDQNGNNRSLYIDSEATTADTIMADGDVTTTGRVLVVSGSGLTTGKLGYFYSNSADTSVRNLIEIVNDNSAANGAACLKIQQDANESAISISYNNSGGDVIYVGAAVQTGQALWLQCDVLTTGRIAYFASNSADVSSRNLVQIVNDNTLATGAIALAITQVAAAKAIYIDMNGNHNAIDIDSENTTQNSMNIISDILTTGGILYLSSDSADTGARHLLDIVNDNTASVNTDCIRLRQDANNWALNILPANYGEIIYSTAVTTGYLLQVSDVSTLTTGKLAYFYSNSADTSLRNLVDITNDNAAAITAHCLNIQQDSIGQAIKITKIGTTGAAIYVDSSATDSAVLSLNDNALTTGKIAQFYSNSSDATARELVKIINDHTSATGTVCLSLQNDRTGGGQAIKIVDGNQGANKVLTSDANGVGTWVTSGGVPSGTILIWSGSIATIPAGYVICDGNNSTPNLTDRFVIHADADAAGTRNVADTGGEQTHALTEAELASHTHPIAVHRDAAGGNTWDRHLGSGTAAKTNTVGTTDSTGSGTAHQNMPKFYALAYIMKT